LTVLATSLLESCHRVLGEHSTRFAIDIVAECTSSNDVIAARPLPGEGRIGVLVALLQTAGRGRRGRHWHATPGDGLTFSCAWPIPVGSPPPVALSLTVGLAVAEAVQALGAGHVGLKWPNDVLVADRKLAGILVELSSGQRRARQAVIGIGLNVLRSPSLDATPGLPATALADHIDPPPDAGEVLASILIRLATRLDAFATGGFASMHADWQRYDAFSGRQVCIESAGQVRSARYAGDPEGVLQVVTDSGVERIVAGELSLRPAI
jgi:BirA family biotin operon repressor/biotin-[acetyl-CoA-carboxylase] ligase